MSSNPNSVSSGDVAMKPSSYTSVHTSTTVNSSLPDLPPQASDNIGLAAASAKVTSSSTASTASSTASAPNNSSVRSNSTPVHENLVREEEQEDITATAVPLDDPLSEFHNTGETTSDWLLNDPYDDDGASQDDTIEDDTLDGNWGPKRAAQQGPSGERKEPSPPPAPATPPPEEEIIENRISSSHHEAPSLDSMTLEEMRATAPHVQQHSLDNFLDHLLLESKNQESNKWYQLSPGSNYRARRRVLRNRNSSTQSVGSALDHRRSSSDLPGHHNSHSRAPHLPGMPNVSMSRSTSGSCQSVASAPVTSAKKGNPIGWSRKQNPPRSRSQSGSTYNTSDNQLHQPQPLTRRYSLQEGSPQPEGGILDFFLGRESKHSERASSAHTVAGDATGVSSAARETVSIAMSNAEGKIQAFTIGAEEARLIQSILASSQHRSTTSGVATGHVRSTAPSQLSSSLHGISSSGPNQLYSPLQGRSGPNQLSSSLHEPYVATPSPSGNSDSNDHGDDILSPLVNTGLQRSNSESNGNRMLKAAMAATLCSPDGHDAAQAEDIQESEHISTRSSLLVELSPPFVNNKPDLKNYLDARRGLQARAQGSAYTVGGDVRYQGKSTEEMLEAIKNEKQSPTLVTQNDKQGKASDATNTGERHVRGLPSTPDIHSSSDMPNPDDAPDMGNVVNGDEADDVEDSARVGERRTVSSQSASLATRDAEMQACLKKNRSSSAPRGRRSRSRSNSTSDEKTGGKRKSSKKRDGSNGRSPSASRGRNSRANSVEKSPRGKRRTNSASKPRSLSGWRSISHAAPPVPKRILSDVSPMTAKEMELEAFRAPDNGGRPTNRRSMMRKMHSVPILTDFNASVSSLPTNNAQPPRRSRSSGRSPRRSNSTSKKEVEEVSESDEPHAHHEPRRGRKKAVMKREMTLEDAKKSFLDQYLDGDVERSNHSQLLSPKSAKLYKESLSVGNSENSNKLRLEPELLLSSSRIILQDPTITPSGSRKVKTVPTNWQGVSPALKDLYVPASETPAEQALSPSNSTDNVDPIGPVPKSPGTPRRKAKKKVGKKTKDGKTKEGKKISKKKEKNADDKKKDGKKKKDGTKKKKNNKDELKAANSADGDPTSVEDDTLSQGSSKQGSGPDLGASMNIRTSLVDLPRFGQEKSEDQTEEPAKRAPVTPKANSKVVDLTSTHKRMLTSRLNALTNSAPAVMSSPFAERPVYEAKEQRRRLPSPQRKSDPNLMPSGPRKGNEAAGSDSHEGSGKPASEPSLVHTTPSSDNESSGKPSGIPLVPFGGSVRSAETPDLQVASSTIALPSPGAHDLSSGVKNSSPTVPYRKPSVVPGDMDDHAEKKDKVDPPAPKQKIISPISPRRRFPGRLPPVKIGEGSILELDDDDSVGSDITDQFSLESWEVEYKKKPAKRRYEPRGDALDQIAEESDVAQAPTPLRPPSSTDCSWAVLSHSDDVSKESTKTPPTLHQSRRWESTPNLNVDSGMLKSPMRGKDDPPPPKTKDRLGWFKKKIFKAHKNK